MIYCRLQTVAKATEQFNADIYALSIELVFPQSFDVEISTAQDNLRTFWFDVSVSMRVCAYVPLIAQCALKVETHLGSDYLDI